MRSPLWLVVAGLLVVAAVLQVFSLRHPLPRRSKATGEHQVPVAPVTLLGTVEAAQQVGLTAPVDGRVVALLVSEGAALEAGEVVLQLQNDEARGKLVAAQKRLAAVEGQVKRAPGSEVERKLEAARIQLEGAKVGLDQAQRELARFISNHPTLEQGLERLETAQAEMENARAAFEAAQREFIAKRAVAEKAQQADPGLEETQQRLTARDDEMRIAQQQLKALEASRQALYEQSQQWKRLRQRLARAEKLLAETQGDVTRISSTVEGRALVQGDEQVAEAQQALSQAQRMVEALTIKTPQAGTLARLNTRPGERVKAGQELGLVQQAEASRLVFRVPAQQLQRLQVGQRLKIMPQGGEKFDGTIGGIVAEEGRVLVTPAEKATVPAPGTALVAVLR